MSTSRRSQLTTIVSGILAGFAGTVVALLAFATLGADAAPGDADATHVSITPCRLIDTRDAPSRVGPYGAFGPAQTRTLAVHGTNGNCVIPPEATGVSLNVTALRASELTYLTIWPSGAIPNASSLNPAPGEPPTPNGVTTALSPIGSFNVYNSVGTVHVIVDVTGYYTPSSLEELHARIVALEAQVAALETKTAPIRRVTVDGQPTVRFSGVNVQVVDGSGDTAGSVNGRGNLIVGYNENSGDVRTGSHNLVVGINHSYSNYGSLVAGTNNTVSGSHASVTGGANNAASGVAASVSGGVFNVASGSNASVTGGYENTASGTYATVTGGDGNTASGWYSSVSGGVGNAASGSTASVAGGRSGSAVGAHSSIAGGYDNTASGPDSSVSGGTVNSAGGAYSAVSGGLNGSASGPYDWVAGSLFETD